MSLPEKITKQEQRIAKLQGKLAREKLKKRKADTRRKIEFGGLVIKAGMDSFPKEIILGALIKAKESLNIDDGQYTVYQSVGKQAFLEKHNTGESNGTDQN